MPARAAVSRARQEADRDRRGTAASRGYDYKWQQFRAAFLAEHPLCRRCLEAGVIVPATVVDHIEPHKGCRVLFWKAGNHQSLCKPCHDRKTVMEDGGFAGGVNWHPPFLRPAVVPLTVVCGAPLAGKSRWIEQRRQPGDVVIDLDQIASAMCGTGLHDWPVSRLADVGRERNRRLLALSDPVAMRGVGRAWFVVCEPDSGRRQWWADTLKPEAIVVVETPRHVCCARAAAERPGPERVAGVIDQWWQTYQRRPGDQVVVCA